MRHFVIGLALINVVLLMPTVIRADDRQIAERIMQTLDIQKSQGKLRGFGINLEVENGNVWLKGHVSSRQQQYLILDVARRVPGVKQVVNDIAVNPQPATAAASPSRAAQPTYNPASVNVAKRPVPTAQQLAASQRQLTAVRTGPTAPRATTAPPQQAARPTQVARPQPTNSRGGLLGMFQRRGQPAPSNQLAGARPNIASPTAKPTTRTAKVQPQSASQTSKTAAATQVARAPQTSNSAPRTSNRDGLLGMLQRPQRAVPAKQVARSQPQTPSRATSTSASSQLPKAASQTAQQRTRPTTVNRRSPSTGVAQQQPSAGRSSLLGMLFGSRNSQAARSNRVASSTRTRPAQTTSARTLPQALTSTPQKVAVQQPKVTTPKVIQPKPTAKAIAVVSQPTSSSAAPQPPKPANLTQKTATTLTQKSATTANRKQTNARPADTGVFSAQLAKLQRAFLSPAKSPGNATASRATLTTGANERQTATHASVARAVQRKTSSAQPQLQAPQLAVRPSRPTTRPQPSRSPALVAAQRSQIPSATRPSSPPVRSAQSPPGIPVAIVAQLQPQMMQGRPGSQMPVAFAQANGAGFSQAGFQPGAAAPIPTYTPGTGGVVPAQHDHPQMPPYAWPSYAAHPNYGAVTYPRQYSPTAWPYIGPFYPYPQVPLGWRKVSLRWKDGWWWLDFKDRNHGYRY